MLSRYAKSQDLTYVILSPLNVEVHVIVSVTGKQCFIQNTFTFDLNLPTVVSGCDFFSIYCSVTKVNRST